MFTFDLLIPWITLAAVLVPLLYVQRWIHRHLFGMGYLIGRQKQAATVFYYMFLLPGVVLHELSHYLMAGVFNIPSTRFTIYPEAQEDGSLEMGFVQLEEVKNPVYAAFIGTAPLLTGIGVVVLISNQILDLPSFFAKLQTGDIDQIAAAVQTLVNKPDFLTWAYILFAVANAMMPNAEDRRGWWLLGAIGGGLLLFLTVIGLHQIVVAWLSGPIANALYSLSAVFATVLFLDVVAMGIIWAVEAIIGRLTGHRVEYQAARPALTAGPSRPSPTSVYELNLPIPPLPGKFTPATPRLSPPERPAITPGTPAPERAALTSGTEEKPKVPPVPAPTSAPRPLIPASKPAPAGTSSRPASPTAPTGQPPKPFGSKPGTSGSKPSGAPISGPPALARPGGPPAKPNLPSTAQRPAQGPAKTPFGAPPRKPEPSRSNVDEDDYIDADVIDEEDEEEQKPAFSKTPSKPSGTQKPRNPFASKANEDDSDEDENGDDDEPRYVGLDEV